MNDIFKALGDPTRRKILNMLREKDLTAGEIADNFNMTKPSISNHLNILKNADLVMSDKKGQYVYYSLNTTVFQEIIQFLFDLSKKGENDNEEN
ncbi:MAG TPA: autorepressor SdpR family transcription factor [Peptostreptococcaceae bacterium]|nr:autorepressor SdpR family transcription factor [Peptostreptococcaceae bacterium]